MNQYETTSNFQTPNYSSNLRSDPNLPTIASTDVSSKIDNCVKIGIPGTKNCVEDILNCCTNNDNNLLPQADAMRQCFDGAISKCTITQSPVQTTINPSTIHKPTRKPIKSSQHEIREGYRYNNNNCKDIWRTIINIILLGLLGYLIYLFINEMKDSNKIINNSNNIPSAPPLSLNSNSIPSAPPLPFNPAVST